MTYEIDDLARNLHKIHDTLVMAAEHFEAEAKMNAALHMAREIRPAPLAMAVVAARDDLDRILNELEKRGADSGRR